jgi:hypothetical protein
MYFYYLCNNNIEVYIYYGAGRNCKKTNTTTIVANQKMHTEFVVNFLKMEIIHTATLHIL